MSTPFLSFNPGDLIKDTHVEQFIQPIQNLEVGKPWYADATGSANAFEVALTPEPAAYVAGMLVNFKANNTVTGAATLNVNGLGVQSLQKEGGNSLISGDIVSGQMVSAIYDGSKFQMISPPINPTVTVASPTENVLVYAETTAQQTSSTVTTLSLPSFNFESGKNYLMEMTVTPMSASHASVQVALSDGTSDYVYPTASGFVKQKVNYNDSAICRKKLPPLSGLHSMEVRASYVGSIEVRLYEIHDNLVYADFSPFETGSTATTFTLEDFTAQAGHTYLLTMKNYSSDNNYGYASCYLTDGSAVHGIPHSDPLLELTRQYTYNSPAELSKLLSGLSGTYQVKVRRSYSGSVVVRIYDLT